MISIPNHIVFQDAEDHLQEGESVTLLLRGTSMKPLLRDSRDCVTISSTKERSLKVGDVVLFHLDRERKHYLLHRIIAIENEWITTQGDNCVTTERVLREYVVGVLTAVRRPNGRTVMCDTLWWRFLSRLALLRKDIHNVLSHCFGAKQRRWQSPLYFVLLAFLMWAPLNGVGIPLNNFVLGIRLDHVLHASVYLFCAYYWQDWLHRRMGWVWLFAILTGLLTESVQYLLPFRGFDINDLIANAFGSTVGWLVLWLHLRGH